MWTHFWDMSSGGGRKEKFHHCFIEAPEKDAISVFYSRFGRNPFHVTCSCCGSDYSVSEGDKDDSLADVTQYQRIICLDKEDGERLVKVLDAIPVFGLAAKRLSKDGREIEAIKHDKYGYQAVLTLDEYLKQDDVLVIYAKDIKPEELGHECPEEHYYWDDEE